MELVGGGSVINGAYPDYFIYLVRILLASSVNVRIPNLLKDSWWAITGLKSVLLFDLVIMHPVGLRGPASY